MKKSIFTIIKWIAAIYSLGYIIFGYSNDTYLMRAITVIMTGIFSFTILVYLFKSIDKKLETKNWSIQSGVYDFFRG